MKLELPAERVRALPVQLIDMGDGVIAKRGRIEVRIRGEHASRVLAALLAAAREGTTREELADMFSAPDRPSVEALVGHLIARGFLVPDDGTAVLPERESALDLFHWHFGLLPPEPVRRLATQRIHILGINHISLRLAQTLRAAGAERVELVDHPLLRNLALFSAAGDPLSDRWPMDLGVPLRRGGGAESFDPGAVDCLVVTSDFGGAELLREWNELSVLHGIPFFPVLLQDLVGSVGPLVIPGETACFECLRLRQASHLRDPRGERAAEAVAFEGQGVCGFHPAMPAVVAEVAAFELTRFFVLGPPLWRVGTVIEVNLLGTEMRSRKVLRLPRCPVCSSLRRTPSVALVSAAGEEER